MFRNSICVLVIAHLVAAALAQPVDAVIGFQAALSDPPRVVSGYDEDPDQFSAAIHPKTYASLSRRPLFSLTVLSASYEQHYLTLTTYYHGDQELVPVSVDADQFLAYRVRSNEQRKQADAVRKSLVEVRSGRRRFGLSIGVALPKRFDQIFGEGGGNLRVSGYRRISFSGRSQWNDQAKSDIIRQNKFPSLNMEQISRFDISGTIGTKISVKVSQDSKTDIPLANRIQIRYKGDEDDILKTIEAGNTTLNLPNTRFVGYSSRIQGLFGLKAEAQLGNLRMVGIASQEKGSSERTLITPGGEESATYIRDYQYVEGRIFDLGYPENVLYPGAPADFEPLDRISVIHVYEYDRRDSLTSDSAFMFVDPVRDSTGGDLVRVKVIDASQYEVRHDPQRNLHFIAFNSPRREALGVYMEIDRYNEEGYIGTEVVGNLSSRPYRLKYLRAIDVDYTPDHLTWRLMWRNCYRIDRGISVEDINLKIFKGFQGREGTTSCLDYQVVRGTSQSFFLEVLGLDQYNRQGTKLCDGIVDDRTLIFEPEWGLVIFPHRTPFDSDTTFVDQNGRRTAPLAKRVPSIYNFKSNSERSETSEYYIQITTLTRSNVIRLNRVNIIEGSERVTLNGRVLNRGTDYNIQYDFGQVTLLTDEASDPNADLSIEFEYAPFLAVQKKTLLGLRMEYEWSRDLKFGSTILYKSDKAQDRKPRVGQETAKALLLDFDISFTLRPQFITKAIDALPLVSTEAPSGLSVSAEIAQSHPNPNVNGMAYIDDFESSHDRLSLSVTRTSWTLSSMPASLDTANHTYQRGKMLWFNPPAIAWDRVYESEREQGEGAIHPLRLVYRPKNVVCELDETGQQVETDSLTRSWTGIMRYFGNRIDAKRIRLFEVRLNGEQGVLHFDFGVINEDTDGNLEDNTEDRDGNNSVDEFEDLGLDGKADASEGDSLRGIPAYDPVTNPDPAGDNWWFEGDWPPPVPSSRHGNQAFRDSVENDYSDLHYEWINGTESNRDDPLVLGIPDEEKLGTVYEWDDTYFSFHIDLADGNDPSLVKDSRNEHDWRTFRIPIRDEIARDTIIVSEGESQPDWSRITHVRVWLESDSTQSEPVAVAIADWYLVQANWQDTLVLDPASAGDPTFVSKAKFCVASVSEEDGTFIRPDEVEPYEDPQSKVVETPRGLALIYDSLAPGDTGMAIKQLVTAENYSGYRRLEMYVHGPENASTDSVFFFLRLGRDLQNFYEYHTMLAPGWEGNSVNIDFNAITGLKDSALRTMEAPIDIDIEDGSYRVCGMPNLSEVRFFAVGVANNREDSLVSGQVWLDELRLTDVRKDVGTAVRLDVRGSMADLLTYSFGIEHKDPYFRGLSAATRGGSTNNLGSGKTQDNYSFGGTLQFHKFLPRSWNSKIPIGFTYSKGISIPLLRTNSDIVLPENVREAEKSSNESRRITISESFARKGGNLLFSLLLNRQKVNFSYTRSDKISVNNPYSFAEGYNVRSEYDMSIRKDVSIPVFAWTKWVPILKKTRNSRLHLFPNAWKWSGAFNRSLSITENADHNRRTSLRRDFNGRMSMNYKMFDNLTMSYNYSTKRDLSDPDLVRISLKNPKLGVETHYSQGYRASYDPGLFSFLGSKFTYSATYTDTWDQSSRSRNSSLDRSWDVNGSFRHLDFLGGGRRSGGFRAATRSNVRGGGPTTGKPEKRPFYDPPLAVLRFLTGWINPLTYRYSQAYRNTMPALQERPSWKYRFGFQDDPGVPRVRNSRNPSSSETVNYEFGSGFTLISGIRTDVRFRQSISRDLVKVAGDRFERKSTGWPQLGIRIGKFDYFPLVKKYINGIIRVFSPRTSYGRQTKEDYNLTAGFTTSRTETISRSPLLAITFKLFRMLSFSGSHSITHTNSERFNPSDGSPQSETRSTKKTMAFSSKYSFSSPGGISIPLLGKLKFKSLMTINMDVRFTSDYSETSQSGGPFVVGIEKSDFSVAPVISYTFSQQLKGGLSARWQDSKNIKDNRTSHVRQLQMWAELRF